mgnify:CR=1 FL=1
MKMHSIEVGRATAAQRLEREGHEIPQPPPMDMVDHEGSGE